MKRLVVLALLALTAACGQDSEVSDPAPPPTPTQKLEGLALWESVEPVAYAFTYTAGSMIGPRQVRVSVRDGKVVSSEVSAPPYLRLELKGRTVEAVFAELKDDQAKADEVKVTYDEVWGFPTTVSVDEIENAIDDEHGYGIKEFQVITPRA